MNVAIIKGSHRYIIQEVAGEKGEKRKVYKYIGGEAANSYSCQRVLKGQTIRVWLPKAIKSFPDRGGFMETDPEKIKKLAKEKEYENVQFRSFLKMIDKNSEEIDVIVHRLYTEISSKIDCNVCLNCCKELVHVLDEEDMEKLSKAMGMSVDLFKEQYVIKDEFGDYIFKEAPCPLFKGDGCMYPDHRPKMCVSFPHLHKEGFVFRTIIMMQNCSVCPIVYNVVEQLKEELGFDDLDLDFDLEDFDLDDFDMEDFDISDIFEALNDLYFRGYNENA
jgi:Fe-S-cluster containining protein